MSKEILEGALNSYEGTVLYVSHDRYFINKTAHRILDLTNKQLVSYLGNYDYYLEKKETLTSFTTSSQVTVANEPASETIPVSEAKQDWKTQKEEQARQRKRENDLKKCEERIAFLEEKIAWIDEEMSKPEVATKVFELQKLSAEQETYKTELEARYEEWELLA
jgi:ATP-binding cassette subfamily F protein 3